MDDKLDMCEDDNYEAVFKTFKDIKEEYNMWLKLYDGCHDDDLNQLGLKEVYAYGMLSEEHLNEFYN